MSNQICPQCAFENDDTRVFCHNCGARLADAPAPASTGKLYVPPTQAEAVRPPARKRIKPVRNRDLDASKPRSSLTRAILSTALMGASLAAIIQMFRVPDGVSPVRPSNEARADADFQTAQMLAKSSAPRVLAVTTDQVNNFLANRIISAAGVDEPWYRPKFVRAFVLPGNGDFRLFIEEKLSNWPVYIQLIQCPVINGAQISMETTGGAIGRLPIHPKLLPYVRGIADPILTSIGEATAPIKNISALNINPNGATLGWPGSAGAHTP